MPHRIIIATRNAHKTSEIRQMLESDWQVLDANDFSDWPAVEETGDTFLANATLKAEAISRIHHGWVLADDSGLCVEALAGAPGVWSSSFGGEEGNHAKNNDRLLREMHGQPNRAAYFICTMALAQDGNVVASFEGRCPGKILSEPRGQHGFGYDPLFAPDGYTESFALLGDAIKNQLSHRAAALTKVIAWLKFPS
jgi:XTP/dITP diphosphohydrolase